MVQEVRGSNFPVGVRPAQARYEGELATVRVGERTLAKIAKRRQDKYCRAGQSGLSWAYGICGWRQAGWVPGRKGLGD